MIVAVLFTGGYAVAQAITNAPPDHVASWTEAVERGLIEGDASYYYNGEATAQEYAHALMVAILAIDDKTEGGTWVTSTTITDATTTSSSTSTTAPPTTTTTSLATSTTSTSTSTSTTAPPTTTTTSTPTTTSTTPSTTTLPTSQATITINAGVHNLYSTRADGNTRYLCEDGAVLDGNDTETYAFYGPASNVTVENCEIRNYASAAQFGAINADGDYWLVTGNNIHDNWGVGVSIDGDNGTVSDNLITRQRQLGVAYNGVNGLFENNEISWNNYNQDYEWGWEAGGSKFWDTDGLIVRGNYVHNNYGPGIWADYNNINLLIEGNLVEDNVANGIFHEIGYAATIRNNTVRRNGFGHAAWLWGSGILIATSQDTDVYGNIVEDNYNGITITQQDRYEAPDDGDQYFMRYGLWRAYNNNVYNNTIKGGSSGAVNDDGDDTMFANNRFYGNTYTDPGPFAWGGGSGDLTWWQQIHPLDG